GNIKNTNVSCFCCLFLHDFLTFFCSLLDKSLKHFNFPSSFRFLFLSLFFLKYPWCFTGSSLTLCRYSLSLSAPPFPFGILVSYDSFSPEQFQIDYLVHTTHLFQNDGIELLTIPFCHYRNFTICFGSDCFGSDCFGSDNSS